MDTLAGHGRALTRFGELVHAVDAGQWHAPTPCTDWDVRQLVNHLVFEQLRVSPIVFGRTVAEVGDALQWDQLGADPVAAWDKAAASGAAFAEPGALSTVHLSPRASPSPRTPTGKPGCSPSPVGEPNRAASDRPSRSEPSH